MKEIKILKKLAQDLSNEKKTLMQKTEKDASIISRLSEEAMAKEDELGRLRTSIETLQTGRPDAFVMNGAGVPGLPVAVMNPKGKNDDCYSDNMENSDEVAITIFASICMLLLEVDVVLSIKLLSLFLILSLFVSSFQLLVVLEF